MTTTLYGYWRSSAAYRLRIALNLKGVSYEQVAINLKEGEQAGADWLAIQPQGLVPVLAHEGDRLLQSPAILEWIDETWPEPAFLSRTAAERCRIRGWASIIGCDIHPLQNLRVLKAVAGDLGQGPDGMKAWAQRWMKTGMDALETLVKAAPRTGEYLGGQTPGLADIYLVPQCYNVRRWGLDMADWPALAAADAACTALPAFQNAAPENQPDAEA
jgi:maleylacetoacetate isomerase